MIKRHIFYLWGVVLTALATSCSEKEAFDISPAERSSRSIEQLRSELLEAPCGWSVCYFPKTDSLLFSNPKALLDNGYRYRYGVGGFCFQMKFDSEGKVSMLADYSENSIKEWKTSEYEIKQNSFTQLSFTTYNYLHENVNNLFSVSADFLYIGKDPDGRLIFRTPRYIEPAREYLVFERIGNEEEASGNMQASYENRLFFEKMVNPQLIIHRGDRVSFRSDMFLKNMEENWSEENAHNRRWVRKVLGQRYWLFVYDKSRGFGKSLNGLGSGYAGTARGLTFRSGIRYSDKQIFYDFRRIDDRFICEPVKVYDSLTRSYRMVSKHLAEEKDIIEEPGFIAEIWDEKQKK